MVRMCSYAKGEIYDINMICQVVLLCYYSMYIDFYVFFFFKQKTAYEIYQCDWSSDVCSSDLDTKTVRGKKPYIFSDMRRRQGLDEIIEFIEIQGDRKSVV